MKGELFVVTITATVTAKDEADAKGKAGHLLYDQPWCHRVKATARPA